VSTAPPVRPQDPHCGTTLHGGSAKAIAVSQLPVVSGSAVMEVAGAVGVAPLAGIDEGRDELMSWSVKDLKAEVRRLRPGSDCLRGAYEKADLCRLVRDLSGGCGKAPPPPQHSLGAASGADELRTPGSQLEELRGLSVATLKDLLMRVRPDLDTRSLLKKDELCRLLTSSTDGATLG